MKCGESNIGKSQEQFKEPMERNLNTRIKDSNAKICNPCPTGSKIEPDPSKLEKRITVPSLGWMLGFRKENYSGKTSFISECFFNFNIFSGHCSNCNPISAT